MVTIGPTRWFVSFSRQQQRGGKAQYDLSLVPEAKSYLMSKVVYEGLNERVVEELLPANPIPVTAWLNLWEANGAEEARLAHSLCRELAAEAVGEALRMQLFRPIDLEKYARQLIVEQGLLLALQKPMEEIRQIEQSDIRADLLFVIEARRLHEEARTREDLERREALRKISVEALQRSLNLLYDNLPKDLADEAKISRTITLNKRGHKWVIPVANHGLVEKYDKEGKLLGKYCLIFQDQSLPAGDEALMKYILLSSDPKTFLAKANFFHQRN